jgi:hypothetical protein
VDVWAFQNMMAEQAQILLPAGRGHDNQFHAIRSRNRSSASR